MYPYSIAILHPLFCINEDTFNRNVNSIKSVLEYKEIHNLDIDYYVYGYCLDKYQKDIEDLCKEAELIFIDRNYGKASVVNEMVNSIDRSDVHYDFYFTLDSDIILDNKEPNIFNRLLVMAGDITNYRNKKFGLIALNQSGANCHGEAALFSSYTNGTDTLVWNDEHPAIAGGCLFLSSAAFKAVGGYSVKGVYAGEDGALMPALIKNGYCVSMVKTMCVEHPAHTDEQYNAFKLDRLLVKRYADRDGMYDTDMKETENFWKSRG